jgi:hypothetical protein
MCDGEACEQPICLGAAQEIRPVARFSRFSKFNIICFDGLKSADDWAMYFLLPLSVRIDHALRQSGSRTHDMRSQITRHRVNLTLPGFVYG